MKILSGEKMRKMTEKLRKSIGIGLAGTFLAILSGCGEKEEPLTITVMTEQFPVYAPGNGEAWLDAIEQETGVNLQITMTPTLEYAATVESAIRGSKLPMVFTANESILSKESFFAYLNAGGFWELEEYLDDYPNLKEFTGEEIWENSEIQGHIYGIPRLRIRPRYAAYYRKDWAEALGIAPPQNLEELYDMLKAFTLEDPDGNGVNDTVGLVNSWQSHGARQWNGVQMLTTVLGGPDSWRYETTKGKMVPDFSTDSYLEMLRWFRTLYQEGILDHSFAFLTSVQRQELFIQGYAGMIFSVIDDGPELEAQMRQMNPQAEIAVLPLLEGPDGEYRLNGNAGYNGLIVFNRLGEGAVRDEEQLREILDFYNTMCGEQGQEILNSEKEEGNSYVQFMPMPAYVRREDDSELLSTVYDCVEEREQYVVTDDSTGLYSETYVRLRNVLNEKIQKASIRFILGEIQEKDYWEEYRMWYESGGKNVIEEYTKAYEQKLRSTHLE